MRNCNTCKKQLQEDERSWLIPPKPTDKHLTLVRVECHECKIVRTVADIQKIHDWNNLMFGRIHEVVFGNTLGSDESFHTFGLVIEALQRMPRP